MMPGITYSRFEALVVRFLDAHRNGEASCEATAGAITHIAAALDQGHRDELRAWTDRPEVFDDLRNRPGLAALPRLVRRG